MYIEPDLVTCFMFEVNVPHFKPGFNKTHSITNNVYFRRFSDRARHLPALWFKELPDTNRVASATQILFNWQRQKPTDRWKPFNTVQSRAGLRCTSLKTSAKQVLAFFWNWIDHTYAPSFEDCYKLSKNLDTTFNCNTTASMHVGKVLIADLSVSARLCDWNLNDHTAVSKYRRKKSGHIKYDYLT